MNKIFSIQVKAAFFLIVFSLNTIIGCACSLGMNLGFNNHHHNNEAPQVSLHVHADGKKHQHNSNTGKQQIKGQNHHHRSKDSNDNCCNSKVIRFVQVDKSLSPSLKFVINPLFSIPFVSAFYNLNVLVFPQITKSIKYFVRSHHPPIPDIRISIQSFQI